LAAEPVVKEKLPEVVMDQVGEFAPAEVWTRDQALPVSGMVAGCSSQMMHLQQGRYLMKLSIGACLVGFGPSCANNSKVSSLDQPSNLIRGSGKLAGQQTEPLTLFRQALAKTRFDILRQ
jgi:hypothetical protein